VSFPGVVLLNQNWQIIPTTTRVGGFELNGSPLPDHYVLWFSRCIAGFLLTKAVLFAVLSYAASITAKPSRQGK
jgi:hypothetical protein